MRGEPRAAIAVSHFEREPLPSAAAGNGTTSDGGPATTANANDLIFGANIVTSVTTLQDAGHVLVARRRSRDEAGRTVAVEDEDSVWHERVTGS